MIICTDCEAGIASDEYATEINPEGGYGRRRVLVCDDCMKSGRWNDWIRREWATWPHARGAQ